MARILKTNNLERTLLLERDLVTEINKEPNSLKGSSNNKIIGGEMTELLKPLPHQLRLGHLKKDPEANKKNRERMLNLRLKLPL